MREGMLLAAGVLNLALAVALWRSAGRRRDAGAGRFLAGVLVVLTGIFTPYVLLLSGLTARFPWLGWTTFSVPLALGPLLWGYIHSLTRGRAPERLWLHLSPALAHLAYGAVLLAAFVLGPSPTVEDIHEHRVRPVLDLAALVSLSAYAVAGLREARRYRAWLPQTRSDAERYAVTWFSRLLIALLAVLVVLTLIRLYTWFVGELDVAQVFVFHALVAGFGAYAGIAGWRCSERRFPVMGEEPAPVEAAGRETPGKDWAELGARWRDETRAAGWAREPDLSLAGLARRLGTNTAYLSRAFNEGLGMNFSEVINRMRAEAVAERLSGPAPGGLLDAAFEAGFSSKASLNRAFRAAFGVSPGQYARQAQIRKIDAASTI